MNKNYMDHLFNNGTAYKNSVENSDYSFMKVH